MTNKEYLIRMLSSMNISENDIDIILLKGSIDADADADVNRCDMAIYNRMSVVIKSMMQNISEGGYSVSWNMDAVKMFYNALCAELGTENILQEKPKIRNKSDLW